MYHFPRKKLTPEIPEDKMVYFLGRILSSLNTNKTVSVSNIAREIVNEVMIERPDWIEELFVDTSKLEKLISEVVSAVKSKEVVKEMSILRPKWLDEIKPHKPIEPEKIDWKPILAVLEAIKKEIREKETVKIDEVSVKGPVEIKEPKWLSKITFSGVGRSIIDGVSDIFDKLSKRVFKTEIQNRVEVEVKNKIKLDKEDFFVSHRKEEEIVQFSKRLISVLSAIAQRNPETRVSNKDNRLINPATEETLQEVKTAIENQSSGGGFEVVGLKDSGDVRINPATEEGQTAIQQAIENITIPAPAGGATEANQLVGLSIIPWLKSILTKIAYPAWFDPTANVIRNQVQSGTITTVTTVTTVTGLTNIDGYQGKMLLINQNNSAWASVVRSRIS